MAAIIPNRTAVSAAIDTKTSLNFLLNVPISLATPIEHPHPTIVETNPIHPAVAYTRKILYNNK